MHGAFAWGKREMKLPGATRLDLGPDRPGVDRADRAGANRHGLRGAATSTFELLHPVMDTPRGIHPLGKTDIPSPYLGLIFHYDFVFLLFNILIYFYARYDQI
jgi:hypothetical protein